MNPNPSQPPGKRGPPRLDPSAARVHKSYRLAARTAQAIIEGARAMGLSQGQYVDLCLGGPGVSDTPEKPGQP